MIGMKKTLIRLAASLSVLSMCFVTVLAEVYPQVETDWKVTFTGKEMVSNFTTEDIQDNVKGMEPGDELNINIALENTSKGEADWWMENKVVKSLEDNSAGKGGAYTYELVYTNSKGENVTIFSSDTVGGEDTAAGVGLHEPGEVLKDYFYLETMGANTSSSLSLHIVLDGETQTNSYQDALGELTMNFAVEVPKTTKKPNDPEVIVDKKQTIVYLPNTGDRSNLPLYAGAFGCSVLLFIIAAVILKRSSRSSE